MRTKKFNKKLNLKKQTISDLNNREMNKLKGGANVSFYPDKPCNTATYICTTCRTNITCDTCS